VVALTVERERLERPRPDPGHVAQAAPAGHRVGGEQVDAAGGDLGRDAPQRQRTRGRQVERGELRRRRRGDLRRRGRVAQPGARAARAEPGDHAALDRDRALELDQLLGDRVRQRLPRQRRAADAELGRGADGLPDHGVVAEGVVERAQVVVDAGREAQPPDAPHRVRLRVRARAEDDAVGRGLDDPDVDRVAVSVEQALEACVATAQQPVGRAAAQAERPRWPDFDAELAVHAPVDTGLRGRLWRCRRKLRAFSERVRVAGASASTSDDPEQRAGVRRWA